MQTLRLRSTGQDVFLLEQLLVELGYNVIVTEYFGKDTHAAVVDFQTKNELVADGICGEKTWFKLLGQVPKVFDGLEKLLSENDLVQFANHYGLELAAVKAVNEVESAGKGFLVEGRPKILFEGHIFWKELQKRAIDPIQFVSTQNANVLFKDSTRVHYEGGKAEYDRLEKAAEIGNSPLIKEAAQASSSWGSFQIMGFHFKSLGYQSMDAFIKKMNLHEREHLAAFGKFLEVNNLLKHLKTKNWAAFARGYNGPGFAKNKYDEKMDRAYRKYRG
jgi:peptidoglycan hydrolase-like protein with peptidoglycan-binding domain